MQEQVALSRDCDAIEIPSGLPTKLATGMRVVITQSLGGTYTVVTDYGQMVRIAGKDADAIGKAVSRASEQSPAASEEPVEQLVWDQLRTIYDPEIPVNIVDLGLVYDCRITPLPEGGSNVEIKMTLTAPGCGMGDVLKTDAEQKICNLPGVKSARVDVVFEPPWDRSMMTEAAKLQLGLF